MPGRAGLAPCTQQGPHLASPWFCGWGYPVWQVTRLPSGREGPPSCSGPDSQPQIEPEWLSDQLRDLVMGGRVLTRFLSFSFMNKRGLSPSPYLGSTSNGYAHPSGTALHYDDAPCINGSVSVPRSPAFCSYPPL